MAALVSIDHQLGLLWGGPSRGCTVGGRKAEEGEEGAKEDRERASSSPGVADSQPPPTPVVSGSHIALDLADEEREGEGKFRYIS